MRGDFILSDGWVFEDGSSSCPARKRLLPAAQGRLTLTGP